MADLNETNITRRIAIRHRGRGSQILIYLGKLLRMFVYQNDWKVLPMSALIAGLVGMVIHKKFCIDMEGTLMGSFAICCVCIWNGCFNSIQVICRERDVIKREHRSGMHISSYIVAHMLYQALLCLGQTFVTLYVTILTGVQYPQAGLVSSSFLVDFAISMFLITYASDMLSLWISSLAHNTTTAMTIMPFVLIFQLVFSGGMLTLPEWTQPLTYFTISNPGLKVIATHADTNSRPYSSIANMLSKMQDSEISGTFTVGNVLDLLSDPDNETLSELRQKEITIDTTAGEVKDLFSSSESYQAFRGENLLGNLTVRDAFELILTSDATETFRQADLGLLGLTVEDFLQAILNSNDKQDLLNEQVVQALSAGTVLDAIDPDMKLQTSFTLGDVLDLLTGNAELQASRDQAFTVKTTLGRVIGIIGENKVNDFLKEKAAAVSYNENYAYESDNVIGYWLHLFLFVIVFALLAILTLEFIDKDKR